MSEHPHPHLTITEDELKHLEDTLAEAGLGNLVEESEDPVVRLMVIASIALPGLIAALREARAENARLRMALEADAADLWTVTNAIKAEIDSRDWIMEGRGPYSWDDDRYKDEARLGFRAVLDLIAEVQLPAANRFLRALTPEVTP